MRSAYFACVFLVACTLSHVFMCSRCHAEPLDWEVLDRTTPVDFQSEILPLLRSSCLACHNAKQAESELNLETPATIRKGGAQGAAVVSRDGAASLLLKAAAHRIDELEMPPPGNKAGASPLSPQQLGLLKLWIDQGAEGEVSPRREVSWRPLPESLQPIFAADVTRDGKFAASARGNHLQIYHVPTRQLVAAPPNAHVDVIRTLAFDATGARLATGGFRNVKLWDGPNVVRLAECLVEGEITSAAVSADGRLCALGTEAGLVAVRSAESGVEVVSFGAHESGVTGLAFSNDGKLLVSTSLDKTIAVWNVADGTSLKKLESPAEIRALVRVGDTLLVTGHSDKLLRVWDWQTMLSGKDSIAPRREIDGHSAPVTALASDRDGEFVSGSEDGTVRRWDATSGRQLQQYVLGEPVVSLAVSSSVGRIAAAGEKSIKLFGIDGAATLAEIKDDPTLVAEVRRIEAQIAFTKSTIDLTKRDIKLYEGPERRVKVTAEAVAKAEQELAKTEKTLGEKESALEKAKGDEKKLEKARKELDDAQQARDVSVTIVERAKVVAERAVEELAAAETVVSDGETRLKALETQKEKAEATIANGSESIRSLAFSADGKRLLARQGTHVHAYDSSGNSLLSIAAAGEARAMAMSASGRLIVGGDHGRAAIYQVKTDWSLARTIGDIDSPTAFADRVLAVAFHPDGELLATGGGLPSRSGELKIWNAADGSLVLDLPAAHADTVLAVAFSPDGELLASAGADHVIKLHRVRDGELVSTLSGHTAHVLGLSFNGDGGLLASCGGDRVVKVWDVKTGRVLQSLEGKMYKIGRYRQEVTAVRFVGDSEQLIAASGDGTLRLHRTSSDNEIVVYDGAKGYLYCAAVSDDGQTIVAGGADGVLRIWSGQNRSPIGELP